MYENEKRIKCPFCAELILKEATICKHCKTRVKDSNGKHFKPGSKVPDKNEVTLGSAMLSNLFCPGYGTWKLGAKMRGGIIFVAITIMTIFYAQDTIAILSPAFQSAMNGNMDAIETITDGTKNNPWGTLITIAYIYSFIDVYLVSKSSKKKE